MSAKIESLKDWFLGRGRVLVALSGGVDSALVAYAAHSSLGPDCAAITADYMTLSEDELDSARQVCSQIGIRHVIITYNELKDERFAVNDSNRCFHCRTQLGQHLRRYATENAFDTIADGTNLDDLGEHRPGIRAMREYRIQSPLLDAEFTKSDVRAAARESDLAVHDRPSNSCLASRIPWGLRVTAERLARIEMGETIVRQVTGARTIRIRDMDGSARVELGADELCLLSGSSRLDISSRLRLVGFDSVDFDPGGYRPGKANVVRS